MLGTVLVREMPGVVRRGALLPVPTVLRFQEDKMSRDLEETQEFDPFGDEDEDRDEDRDQDDDPVLQDPRPYLPRWAVLP